MAETVRLTVRTGPHKGQRFCFRGPTRCLVGRAHDCFIRLVGDDRDMCISRRHCQLLVDPPRVLVEDLGSSNGTYVNGQAIEATNASQESRLLFEDGSPIGNVRSGDIITIGGTSIVVDIVDCAPDGRDPNNELVWKETELSKKDCAVPCPS